MKLQLFLICSLLPLAVHAQNGNTQSQEVGDVVFRRLDVPVNIHGAIYVGQTNKTGSTPSLPFKHTVIEMLGVPDNGTKWGKVISVSPISYMNFQEFRSAHTHYYGAFTINNPDYPLQVITQDQRKLILEVAQNLFKRRDEIAYAVVPGDYMPPLSMKLARSYFATGVDAEGNQTLTTSYTGNYRQISMMRSDAFVEYCYASAGVPIMPDNLATYNGALALVLRAAEPNLLPTDQRARMFAAQVENPALIAKDSAGNEIAGETGPDIVTFEMSDRHSGPGLLKIHRAPVDGGYGNDDFPFSRELMKDGQIQTGNIQAIVPFPYSHKYGLEEGYYTATAYDHAGNSSQEINFKIPELSAININSANALYYNFRGISATAPSTLERSHTFDFSEPMAGVSAVSIDGPQGNLVSWNFNPPVYSTSTSLSDLPVGDYTVKSFNAVGEETKTPFKIGEINVHVSSEASRQTYAYSDLASDGTFYITVHVEAGSPAGVKRVELISSSSTLLSRQEFTGAVADTEFSLPEGGASYNPPTLSYVARVTDADGDVKDVAFQINARHASHGLYPDEYPTLPANWVTHPYSYTTKLLDLATGYASLFPGAVLSNYGVYADGSIEVGTGFFGSVVQTSDPVRQPGATSEEVPGHVYGMASIYLNTWDNDGNSRTLLESGSVWVSGTPHVPNQGEVCGYSEWAGVQYCYMPSVHSPRLLELKRYSDVEVNFVVTDVNSYRKCSGTGEETYCSSFALGASPTGGFDVKGYGLTAQWPGIAIDSALGDHIKVPLSSYGEVEFDRLTSQGTLSATVITSKPPNGFAESPANTTYEITRSSSLAFSGLAKLTLKYNPAGLSAAQEQWLRLAKVIDPATGKYEILDSVLDTANKTISANVSSFSKFMVLAPEYSSPQAIQGGSVNGAPELEFMSSDMVSLSQHDMSGTSGQATLAALKSANKLPVGNVYLMTASTDTFEPAGAIKMRYDAANVAMLGVSEESLAIYGISLSGDLYKLPYLTVDRDNKALTARVPTAGYSLYAVLASSIQVENIPPSVYPDGISPVTAMSFGGMSASVADGTIISSAATVMFSAADPQVPNVVTSGVSLTNYILSPEAYPVEISTYTGPFHLPEGVHPMYYLSVDNAGNYEFPKGTTVYVDATAPETTLGASVFTLAPGSSYYATVAGDISLTATDPLVSGVRSGIYKTFYLVDTQLQECPTLVQFLSNPTAQPPVFTGVSGTCDNPLYTLPFVLSTGTHSVQYFSADSVGNLESPKTFYLDVMEGDTVPPDAYLSVNGSTIPPGGTVEISAETKINVSAIDPSSTGIVSGLKSIYFLVDVSPDSCGEMGAVVSTAPAGSCLNYLYTAPFTLAEGTHTVYYTAMDLVGNMAPIKSAFFTVSPGQAALPIAPSSGPIGVPFTIEGVGFGTYSAGTTVVLLGGTTAPLTLWTDTKIQGIIPGALAAGQYPVQVKRGAEVLAEVSPFTVTQPALYALTPSSGAIGLPFTITGESFGNYVAGYTRVLLGGTTMPLTLWTDTKIQGTIPGPLPVGDYELVVERALNGGVVRTSTAAFSLRNMEAYWLAPSSGPIGMPFTITGVGFGNYSSVYTHVLIGDTTAPLTLWTDSKIQGTIPGSLASGQYPVLVERRTSDGGVMQTSPMTFEVVNVDVASMTPVAGPIGLPFTIYGGNFGNYVAGFTRVLIGDTTCPLTLWTADKIQGAVPGALGPGSYPVIVERQLNDGIVQSQALAFMVSTPTVYNMTPSSGPIGLPFTINGENFGNYSAAYTGVLINGATVPLTLWTDTQIKGTIPGNLVPGQYPVMVGRMTADGGMVGSNVLTFEVVGVNVASMTPVAGPIGMPFTIYGANFGNYAANYTKVLIGGATCPLTLWTDNKIQGTVPGGLAAGDYQVLVERSLNGGQVQSQPLAFSVALPAAYSLSPSSGPIGLPFTIMGANFGNYVANYTKVLIGGVAAPLTLWTDTKIQGTIPGSLAAGDHEVVVERALNGGVVRTSTFTFTVGTPYLATVSPSTASVIAPFTITGYNFGTYVANYTKVLINGTTTALTLWTDTKIQGKLPYLLAGTYPVQVQRYLNGGLAESATAYINVEEPTISSMTPTSGAVGAVFNLYGTGFGPYDASIAKVFLGGTQCALSLWTDTKITGTVPSGLSSGTHTVVAARSQAMSNALEFYLPGGYGPSMMRFGLSPSALEFKLGEVYVYPDPAKGGKVPTFHIEVGTADSVKLKVYTVSGQLAHETTLTGSPQAVGSVYAYEYPWAGRIASGVYYYTIEAERSGKKLRTKGKFSVVR